MVGAQPWHLVAGRHGGRTSGRSPVPQASRFGRGVRGFIEQHLCEPLFMRVAPTFMELWVRLSKRVKGSLNPLPI